MKIVLTNDDGYSSPFLQSWFRYCTERMTEHSAVVVAPKTNKSGISQAITIHGSLRYEQIAERVYAVDGTPADCVNLAFDVLGGADIVFSGPNIGSNLGRDVFYSGTVAAAREAVLHGAPALAFSVTNELRHPVDGFDEMSLFSFLDKWLNPLMALVSSKKNTLINLNIASFSTMELYEAKLSDRHYLKFQARPAEAKSFVAEQAPGVDNARRPAGGDWDLAYQGKNVYTVLDVWPSEHIGTEQQLRSLLR